MAEFLAGFPATRGHIGICSKTASYGPRAASRRRFVGEFVNFRIRALLLLIQLLKCENLTFLRCRKPQRRLHLVGGDPV
jgi:hypothetical protein